MTNVKDEIPILEFEDKLGWEAWLNKHHNDSKGIWLKIARKGSGLRTVSPLEALDVALAYGWITGRAEIYNEKYYLIKFVPRRPGSVWSRINRDKALELIKTGKMQPSGMKQVELAKANGEWERAYDPQSEVRVPDDLQDELNKNPKAREFFSGLDSQNRYAVLFRIQTAKRPETRSARIKKFVEMLSKHEKLHPSQLSSCVR